jgi:hypothetical protein
VCASGLKRVIRETGGFALGEGFLKPELVATVAAELVAVTETLELLKAKEASTGA